MHPLRIPVAWQVLPGIVKCIWLTNSGRGEVGTASAGVNVWGGIEAAGFGDGTSANGYPKAFVNIILFDKDYKFLDVAYAQVTSSGAPAALAATYTVKEDGYAYLYISNEQPTQTDVYFDDVTMTYTPSNIVQYNEYYPFGMQASTSWTRTSNKNNFLYNDGSEINATTALYDLPFRNYDPALGRFFQVDPLAHMDHSVSPFAYAGNNPVMFNDPWGLMVGVSGYSDGQLRSMYRRDRDLGGYSRSFGDWAKDNLDFGGGGRDRTVFGTDGREYGVGKNGQIGYWKIDDRTTSTGNLWDGTLTINGKRDVFVQTNGGSSDIGLRDLSAVLFTSEATLFNIEAYAQYGLARNEAIRSSFTRATGYYWNPGRLKGSDQFLKGLKVMGGTLAKYTFYGGVAVSVAGVIQNPTLENGAWAAADITVGLIGLNATAVAGFLTTAGLAIPGLNLIIVGGALVYSGYRLNQAFNED